MPVERVGLIKFAGKEQTVLGADIKVGQKAPEFTIQKTDWSLAKGLKETKRKVRIIASVPSLDTPVCDRETRRFNEEAAKLGKDIAILVLSMDLPVAQKRWCGAAGVDQVLTFSDVIKADFGKKYGTKKGLSPTPPTWLPTATSRSMMKSSLPPKKRSETKPGALIGKFY
jgi:thiol peroxidase